MSAMRSVAKRELRSYFSTPLALVFIVIFLVLAGSFAFYVGGFFERGQANLDAFFVFHPWLYLFFIPAVAMRLWAEERKSGTIELLLTLPIPFSAAVLGKYFAAWIFAGIALALTFPLWITVNYLGDPDNGVILAGYLGSWLMAGGYLAIGMAMSAVTRSQVVAFVLGAALSFLFTVSGLPMVLSFLEGWLPAFFVNMIAGFSFLTHFEQISKGILDAKDVFYFASVIALWLFVTTLIVDAKREAG